MIHCKRCGNHYTEGQKPSCNLFDCPVTTYQTISVHDMGRAGTAIMEAEYLKLKSQLAELEKIATEMSEDMQGCESCFEQKSLSALTAYRQKWQGEKVE